MTYIYTISYPAAIEKEDFVGLFFDMEHEGIEEKEDAIDVYLNEAQLPEGEPFIRELCERYALSYARTELEHKNWNEQWESSFQPILLDDFVYVRATFHPANEQVQHEIIIEPKMSFGTGHHPTTSQMMQNMRLLDFSGKTVLDCGSGTGILAVLAEKLGAQKCIALDNDEWCYQNCRENMVLNNCRTIEPVIGDLGVLDEAAYDIVLGNIHRNFLVENMAILAGKTKLNGFVIVSGFYSEDAPVILNAALEHHLIANYRTTQHNWDCIVLQRNK